MAEFKGLTPVEHEKLTRAVNTHERITGEKVDISSIPVYTKEKSKEELQKAAQDDLDHSAKVARDLEDAQRKQRQVEATRHRGDDVQSENPGPGQPAMVTERAKAQGVSRDGEEPESAKPGRGGRS